MGKRKSLHDDDDDDELEDEAEFTDDSDKPVKQVAKVRAEHRVSVLTNINASNIIRSRNPRRRSATTTRTKKKKAHQSHLPFPRRKVQVPWYLGIRGVNHFTGTEFIRQRIRVSIQGQ